MNDLINGTLQEAIEKLAHIAAVRRTTPFAVKTAAGVGDFLSSLGEKVQSNPALSHALIGGGLGSAAMGVNTAFNNRGKDPSQKRSVMGSILTGGLAGAGVGAGVGAARQGLDNLKTGPGSSGLGSDALKPGQFTDPATGQKMTIDPKALKENPELHKQVKSLTTPTLQTTLAGGVGSVLQGVKDRTPTTASILPWVAGADAAMHMPGFGINRIQPWQAGGHVGRELYNSGLAEAAKSGLVPKALVDNHGSPINVPPTTPGGTNITTSDRVEPKNYIGRKLNRLGSALGLTRENNQTLGDYMGSRTGPAKLGDRGVANVEYTPKVDTERTSEYEKGTKANPEVRKEKTTITEDGTPVKKKITEHHAGTVKHTGHGKSEAYAGRQLYRLPGTNKTYAGMTSYGRGAALRAGLYGAPMAAEYLYRGLEEDVKNKESLRELMARHAKPVPEGK